MKDTDDPREEEYLSEDGLMVLLAFITNSHETIQKFIEAQEQEKENE